MNVRVRFILTISASLLALSSSAAALAEPVPVPPIAPAPVDRPISEAEKKIFLEDHLGGAGAAHVLRYHYRQTGSLDKPYTGSVVLTITPKGQDRRAVAVAYLDGEHKVALPTLDDARANPVILYFLEQDVRDMHRRLGGSESYFRRRIRLALAEGAEMRPTSLSVDGRQVDATEVVIRPFVGDPMKTKLGAFENKSYAFALSDRVPGRVLRLRSLVSDEAAGTTNKEPLLEDVLMFEGAAQ